MKKIRFQFRNYIRATVNALLIGHVTPLLWTQPCFECTEIFSWLTFLLCRSVLNTKAVNGCNPLFFYVLSL